MYTVNFKENFVKLKKCMLQFLSWKNKKSVNITLTGCCTQQQCKGHD